MSKLIELANLGQSIWLDYISRSFITTGELQKLIDEGLRGITSNPTILEKAIADSSDYDSSLKDLIIANQTVHEIYEALVLEDIGETADLFRPVYETTYGLDGYVSLEVNPSLAYHTEGTIQDAIRLFTTLKRPNIMIKVPATMEGIPAISELISHGININATLMFGMEHYLNVTDAYLTGLEWLLEGGGDLTKVASVASFFVSRVDTAVDKALKEIGNQDLQGKIAIANSRLVYQKFLEIFNGPRWEKLAAHGARVQRVLWASTSTKNPNYPDTLYVDELIGKDTVNTLPPATLTAFQNHGKVAVTIDKRVQEAKAQIHKLSKLGINFTAITDKLQAAGVIAFSESFDNLMKVITEKRNQLLSKKKFILNLNNYQTLVETSIEQLKKERIIQRIWQHDYTVWKPEPTEITNRLGWLHSPTDLMAHLDDLQTFVNEIRSEGFTQALLLGMGGSSLAPEVFRKMFGVKDGYLNLAILDSTVPEAILSYANQFDPKKTLYIVSTKSGSTIETLSFMKFFYNQTLKRVGKEEIGNHFIAITDAGSGLETLAKELKFRRIFRSDPNVGGRYSALTHFGLVPAALLGIDLKKLLERAQSIAQKCKGYRELSDGDNPGALLGAILGELALQGRDKVTFITSRKLEPFGVWLEQLIAESTGKEGVGIVPIIDETVSQPEAYANDVIFIHLQLKGDTSADAIIHSLIEHGHPVVQVNLNDCYDLGGEFFRWEMATAIAVYFLKINPFDQPNVESAKILARKMVAAYQKSGHLPEPAATLQLDNLSIFTEDEVKSLKKSLQKFLAKANPGTDGGKGRSYVAIQAFIHSTEKTDRALQEFRAIIQKKHRLATTIGFGPRFLHSTGQLHKGDAGNGLFIQLTETPSEDISIPDKAGEDFSSITFGVLALAQALGDRQALLDAGRRIIRFHFNNDTVNGIKQLIEALD